MSPALLHPDTGEKIWASQAGAAVLRRRGYVDASEERASTVAAAAGSDEQPEKTIDQMSGKELDTLAAQLEVDGWKPSAKVDAKKATLKAWIEANPAEQPDGLDDFSDDELQEKVAEFEIEGLTPDADRDTVIAAIRGYLDDLSDEDLAAKVAELEIEVEPDADREALLQALRTLPPATE